MSQSWYDMIYYIYDVAISVVCEIFIHEEISKLD